MRDKIKSLDEYKTKVAEGDCIWLLTNIKGIMMRFEGQRSLFLSLDDAERNLILFWQGPDMTLATYKTEFETLVDVFEHYGGTIGTYPELVKLVEKKVKDPVERVKCARIRKLAMTFLNRADRRRYGALWADLENQFARDNDQYPADLTEAYSMLVNYKPLFPTHHNKEHDRPNRPPAIVGGPAGDAPSEITGTTLLGPSKATMGTNGVTHEGITCYQCNHKGHYASECPSVVVAATQHLQITDTTQHDYGFTFVQPTTQHEAAPMTTTIPNTWILLDSQSTVCVFNNKHLLTNIRQSPRPLEVSTNGGPQVSTLIGDIKNFGTVWYNPLSLANILFWPMRHGHSHRTRHPCPQSQWYHHDLH
jgi:hypothetical protein